MKLHKLDVVESEKRDFDLWIIALFGHYIFNVSGEAIRFSYLGLRKLGMSCAFAAFQSSHIACFQPFIRPTASSFPEVGVESKRVDDQNFNLALSPSKLNNSGKIKAHVAASSVSGSANAHTVEREEGEWSDAEGSGDVCGNYSTHEEVKASLGQGVQELMESDALGATVESVRAAENIHSPSRLDQNLNEQMGNNVLVSEGNGKGDISIDGQEEPGKTMFLNLEDVKQAGPIKTSTPRRQNFLTPVITRTVKEVRTNSLSGEHSGEKQGQPINEDQKLVALPSNDASNAAMELCDGFKVRDSWLMILERNHTCLTWNSILHQTSFVHRI
ncbi:hypothetical protein F3Y22_tig00112491pilonHSYRG00353 [Hibiscus syriacus]|uniref:Uncharacterized protein n=1 Tax=Hibiscus syriacus TaxID=106335 RepID=A0A6A2WXW4_HIBSY|nr:hypothetical protein F3Y22_tig00112491pilonHSYRG00353 [Hibiscus syriacus]